MASEWTKQEYEVAMEQRDELFPGFGECSGDPETEETAENMLDLLCQRNRALAALEHTRDLPMFRERSVDPSCACTTCEVLKEIDAAIAACEKEMRDDNRP